MRSTLLFFIALVLVGCQAEQSGNQEVTAEESTTTASEEAIEDDGTIYTEEDFEEALVEARAEAFQEGYDEGYEVGKKKVMMKDMN